MLDQVRNGPFGPDGDIQLAQAPGGAFGEPIGTVENLAGKVFITHVDGTQEQAAEGMPVYQGDMLKTGEIAQVGITFADDSTFALGGGGEMTLDEMVYDPGSQTGSMGVQVVEGVFSFVSGQIAKTGADAMVISTPVATIGVRGSAGAGRASQDKPNMFSLLQDPDGTVGEINISTDNGTETLNQAFATTRVTNPALPPDRAIVLSQDLVGRAYGNVGVVAGQQSAQRAAQRGEAGGQRGQEGPVAGQQGEQGAGEGGPPEGVPQEAQQVVALGQQVGEAAFEQALAQGADIGDAFNVAFEAGAIASTRAAAGMLGAGFASGDVGLDAGAIDAIAQNVANEVVGRMVGRAAAPGQEGGVPGLGQFGPGEDGNVGLGNLGRDIFGEHGVGHEIQTQVEVGITQGLVGGFLAAGQDLQFLAQQLIANGMDPSEIYRQLIQAGYDDIAGDFQSAYLSRPAGDIQHALTIDENLVDNFDEVLSASRGNDYLIGGPRNTEFVMKQGDNAALPSGTLGGIDRVDGGDGTDQITFDNLSGVAGIFYGGTSVLKMWNWAGGTTTGGDTVASLEGTTAKAAVTFVNMEQLYFGSYDGSTDQKFGVEFSANFQGMMVAGDSSANYVNFHDGNGGGTVDGNAEVGETDGDSWWDTSLSASKYGVLVLAGGGNDVVYGTSNNSDSNEGDILIGGDGDDHLFGLAGSDNLYGGAGADLLWGGAGHDKLYLGDDAAADTVAYSGSGEGTTGDYIYQFKTANDDIELDKSGFSLDATAGSFGAANYTENTIANISGGTGITASIDVVVFTDASLSSSAVNTALKNGVANSGNNAGSVFVVYSDGTNTYLAYDSDSSSDASAISVVGQLSSDEGATAVTPSDLSETNFSVIA